MSRFEKRLQESMKDPEMRASYEQADREVKELMEVTRWRRLNFTFLAHEHRGIEGHPTWACTGCGAVIPESFLELHATKCAHLAAPSNQPTDAEAPEERNETATRGEHHE